MASLTDERLREVMIFGKPGPAFYARVALDERVASPTTRADARHRVAVALTGNWRRTVTVDDVTDEQIAALLMSLPTGHHATQWCHDAIDSSHPMRRTNARRECAALINEMGKEKP